MILPLLGLVALAAAGVAVLVASPGSQTQAGGAGSTSPTPTTPITPPTPPTEIEALARCLASEDADPTILVAIAWLCIQVARRRKTSMLALLTSGLGWGPQKVWVNGKSVIRFASTDKPPTDLTMLLAAAVLSGAVEPSSKFRAAAPTSFVEKTGASRRIGPDGRPLQPETKDDRLIALQEEFGGLVGRIGRWYFYRLRAPPQATIAALPILD